MSTNVTRRREEVPIFQGDDAAAIEIARLEFNAATITAGPVRLNTSPVTEAAEAYDVLVAEALPRAVKVTVQALGRKTYRTLLAEHPPRENDETDAANGFNSETMADAVLEFLDAETGERSIVAPDFASKKDLVAFLDDLNDGNFAQLFAAATRVNEGGSPDPKASLTLRLEQVSSGTSRSPERTT